MSNNTIKFSQICEMNNELSGYIFFEHKFTKYIKKCLKI